MKYFNTMLKKHVETKECCFNERPNKKQLTTSAREFPKKVQTTTFLSIYWCVIAHYWPILIVFVKYRVYSQLTLVQYLKIVRYSGWINQGLCSTLCWMKTIFLASRSFVTITENLMSCSLLVDYGVINFTLPAAHWRRKPRPPFPTTSTNNR